MTGKVALTGLEFHAFHGVYPHERESGNWFEVNIIAEAEFLDEAFHDHLEGTVNYETLFNIVRDEMDTPSKLLETVAGKIVDRIIKEVPLVNAVEIQIAKLNPPIGGKCQKAWVSIERRR